MPRNIADTLPRPLRASLQDEQRVVVLFTDAPVTTPKPEQFAFEPETPIKRTHREGRRRIALIGGPFDMRCALSLHVDGHPSIPVLPDGILDRYVSFEPLGLTWAEGTATLQLFHPRARAVHALFFDAPDGEPVERLELKLDETSGIWCTETGAIRPGQFYGYRVTGPDDVAPQPEVLFCDPCGWMVAKSPGWPVRMLSAVPDPSLVNLPAPGHVTIPPRDLMIYEAHLKDVSMHGGEMAGPLRGTYDGVSLSPFLPHVKRIGMNAVEWLPLHVYDHREPPFGSPGNNWNETGINHWGYMSVQYFAPEPRYHHDGDQNEWTGTDPAIVHDVRAMVKSLHDNGLAVILDVVYNHVGNYGQSPLRLLDPKYWLRLNGDGTLKSDSGCGNDLATERPMARRMIVDSLKHWMNVYGIDGFRFDLAGLIDDGTLDTIEDSLRAIHPGVHLIAEPWGGLYDKRRFAVRGWAAWNDLYRDGLRGHDAQSSHGALLGKSGSDLLRNVRGHVAQDGGPFDEEWQSVNYLASHDDYCFGDFLRIATGLFRPDQELEPEAVCALSANLLLRARLGYFLLFTSRGMLMLFSGDEWLRAKIVHGEVPENDASKHPPRKLPGELDRDSYNRDDDTNWLRWEIAAREPNRTIVDYVSGLAQLRRRNPALRVARHANIHPLKGNGGLQLAYVARVPGNRLAIYVNLDDRKTASFELPKDVWVLIADETQVFDDKPRGRGYTGEITLPPLSARLLRPRDTRFLT